MALIKCKECGKDISDQATSCPNCGAKMKNTNYIRIIIGIVLIVIGLCLWVGGINISSNNDNYLKYNENNNTYTYTIWESEIS